MIGTTLILALTVAAAQPAPISFRCDNMEVTQSPAHGRCQGNAIARQNTMLICCDSFVTKADEKWQWQTLHCVGNVRARRGSEWAWADEAIFNINDQTLTLQGRPILQRGKSLMQGEQIIIENTNNKARIIKPTGILHHAPENVPPQESLQNAEPLPNTCPLPARPEKTLK